MKIIVSTLKHITKIIRVPSWILENKKHNIKLTWKYPFLLINGKAHMNIMSRITTSINPDKYANPGPTYPISLRSVRTICQYLRSSGLTVVWLFWMVVWISFWFDTTRPMLTIFKVCFYKYWFNNINTVRENVMT